MNEIQLFIERFKKLPVPIRLLVGFFSMVIVYHLVLWWMWGFKSYYYRAHSCLANHGCWDYVDNVCRKFEPDAPDLCRRRPRD